ncbi:MAG TPA: homocysteine methyltransferase [Clostridiaceae bacterium]|nr:homocysteine methyltransferase [Clostridiaceae bacterium]
MSAQNNTNSYYESKISFRKACTVNGYLLYLFKHDALGLIIKMQNDLLRQFFLRGGENIMDFKEKLGNSFILFDGAMGTMIQNAGLEVGEMPEVYNIIHPEIVKGIHESYIKAGADVITTNTFGVSSSRLLQSGYTVEEIIWKAVGIAKAAGSGLVALDIGPTGRLMEPFGDLSFDMAYDIFKRQVEVGVKAGVDLILIETLSDVYEAKAAVLAAKENSSIPVLCTMTFQKSGRTIMGTDPLTAVNILEGLGIDAIGANCSIGPAETMPIIAEMLEYSSIPVMVQPNAGLPRVCKGKNIYDIKPLEFAKDIKEMAKMGARIFGGCCGTNPDFIKEIHDALAQLSPVAAVGKNITAASSSSRTVILGDEFKVIGENINPTGKAKLTHALKNDDMEYIASLASKQGEAGADMLDINTGIPDIDEKDIMIKVIREIQTAVKLPIMIDSISTDVLEAAARQYDGKPVINSVSGKEMVMERIFPIAKKYGACIIGLTLDEKGIPKTAEERVNIAGKIIEKAHIFGIKDKDIIIDCLVLTASAQQESAMEAIKAVKMVKDKYKVATVLGVSNISYGLPERKVLNRTYLAMALAMGLDSAIVNPMDEGIMDTVKAFKVIANQDKNAADYIKNCKK